MADGSIGRPGAPGPETGDAAGVAPVSGLDDEGWGAVARYAVGALLGGTLGAVLIVAITTLIKEVLAVASRQDTWVIITLPVLALGAATFVLHVIGCDDAASRRAPRPPRPPQDPRHQRRRAWYLPRIPLAWRTFPSDVARADLTGDVVASAGVEERFPWRQAPLRALAIVITVGLGAPMGTESPAAHLGTAAGSWLGQSRPQLRRMLRGAAIAGGAAGVSVLMGVALIGTAFILELGRRRQVPLRPARVAAALVGGVVGWLVNIGFDLNLIRLITPKVAPDSLFQIIETCLYVGVLSGLLTSVSGAAIYRVKGWTGSPVVRLVVGAGAMLAATLTLLLVADGGSAVGPGGGAILWAEGPGLDSPAWLLLLVAALRATATTAAVTAGGCGGIFVPFLAIGDLAGRAFAPHLGISGDLAGASGAASGIAGGYRLPVTAVVMVIGIGGPALAVTTSLGCVLVASVVGVYTSAGLDRLRRRPTVVIGA
ncbi:MAG TPA: chloride channel protein [Dermatophilaceae bacterium]|nr:chloride channel protein [Dermatophilaceae bacterium]